jgi:hypothetical protein
MIAADATTGVLTVHTMNFVDAVLAVVRGTWSGVTSA